MTPFIIWTNYELESQEIDKINANYLGAKILETANLELTDYDKLLLKTWDSVPALTKNGYYLADGSYTAWGKNTEKPEELLDYQKLEYNAVADRKNRIDELFTITP